MPKRSSTMDRRLLTWLVPLLTIGLSGYTLLRRSRTSKTTAFDLVNRTKYKQLKPLIIAQSKLESANYTSDLFQRSNNAFGMKNATIRKQLGFSVPGDPYRHYSSLGFLLWLDYNNFPTIVPDAFTYARRLKELNYYESPQVDYARALNSWL